MKTIYKTDTKGNTRYLKIYTNGPQLIQESGLLDTESPIVHVKTCKPKNVGKKNASTAEEQAISEMTSKITDKLTQGYCESLEVLESSETILPMLAKEYPKESHKIDWKRDDTYGQTKCDGQRCLAHIKPGQGTVLISRDGKVIATLKHIEDGLNTIQEDIILDGELYAHGYSFNENMKMIKKYRPGLTEKVLFHVYDIISDEPYSVRKEMILKYQHNPIIEIVESIPLNSEQDLFNLQIKHLGEGYEGTILRHGTDGYKKNGRSSSLLKFKDFDDIALVLLDVVPCEQKPEWGCPQFYWKGAKNDTLEAGTKMTHEERVDLLTNKQNYIGKRAELRYFGVSDKGVPRQPILYGFRNDK